jgi:hypothetical protein
MKLRSTKTTTSSAKVCKFRAQVLKNPLRCTNRVAKFKERRQRDYSKCALKDEKGAENHTFFDNRAQILSDSRVRCSKGRISGCKIEEKSAAAVDGKKRNEKVHIEKSSQGHKQKWQKKQQQQQERSLLVVDETEEMTRDTCNLGINAGIDQDDEDDNENWEEETVRQKIIVESYREQPKKKDHESDMEWSWSEKEEAFSSDDETEEDECVKENPSLMLVKTSWRRCSKRIDSDLLISNYDSRMECEHLSVRKVGEPGYAALPLNERNNCDLQRIYEIRFGPAKGRGHPIAAYSNIKSTFGQFARLCVCLKLLDLKDVWKPGAIFGNVLRRDTVFSFIAYFRLRGQATTVSNKAANLKMVVEHAGLFFTADAESRAKADELRISLDRARSAERREIRKNARNTTEEREAAGKLLNEGDMDAFAERAYEACRGILKSAKQCRPAKELFTRGLGGPALTNKWCLNLLSFLRMVGNGQRPQVYRQLLLPTPEQMNSWTNAEKDVSLRAFLEKTPRSMECPAVLFPRRSASLLKFHVLVVRPLIIARLKIEEPDDRSEYPLLVHTKTGKMLSTGDVRRTLRAFLTRHDPELAGITPMILRSSFASTMFARFKRGELGDGKSVEAFLADLGKLMNTSSEMLMANYIASNPQDFPKTVLTLFRAFQNSEEADQDEGKVTTPGQWHLHSKAAGAGNSCP